jgi:hypothetical protein
MELIGRLWGRPVEVVALLEERQSFSANERQLLLPGL